MRSESRDLGDISALLPMYQWLPSEEVVSSQNQPFCSQCTTGAWLAAGRIMRWAIHPQNHSQLVSKSELYAGAWTIHTDIVKPVNPKKRWVTSEIINHFRLTLEEELAEKFGKPHVLSSWALLPSTDDPVLSTKHWRCLPS